MELTEFIRALTSRVYKALLLREDEISGKVVYATRYIEGLCVEAVGAAKTFPQLSGSTSYISVCNILNGLNSVDDYTIFRREILTALRMLNEIERGIKGGDDSELGNI